MIVGQALPMSLSGNVVLHWRDIPERVAADLGSQRAISWDIETTGLDFRSERIAMCQLVGSDGPVHVVRIIDEPAPNLCALLQDRDVIKIFHHAMFDVRFMRFHWAARAHSVVCTKIAAKVLQPGSADQSLKRLAREFLGITLDKSAQRSDWLRADLSVEQLRYAAEDVRHLHQLFDRLRSELLDIGRWDLAEASFDYIPTRVELDVEGPGDVFVY
jgi:ribonuclease D